MICAQIEAELVSLGKEEAENYLKELGVTSSGIEKMIKSAYDILNLQTYITAGEKEVGPCKSLARLEGKEYVVQDGDIMLFRFNT